MINNQAKQQTAAIIYTAPRAVNIGDVFYIIERGQHQCFREPCKVCRGEKQITINNVTFRCPCCDNQKETITIYPHVVHRYRVCAITDSVLDYDWKASTDHTVKFELYRKIGHRYLLCNIDSGGHFEFNSDGFTTRQNAPYSDIPHARYGIYDDYNLAITTAGQMTAHELNRLAEYNKEFGTSHVANFKIEHDPKSI